MAEEPEKHKLLDGSIIYRLKNPGSNGYSYYAKAGPDGDILIWNSDIINLSTLAAVIAWHTSRPFHRVKKYIEEFNMHGWRL